MSVIGSIVANLSANTEALARDMDRGVMIVESGFARMNKIQAGGFVEGLNIKGMESSLAKVFGSGTGSGGGIVEAAAKTGQKASVELSEKFKNGFEKASSVATKVLGSGDMLSKVGSVGLAFGGWGLAIGGAVELLKAVAPIMDQILFGTQRNIEAAGRYVEFVQEIFGQTQNGSAERIVGMANGSIARPDWITEWARNGGDERLWGFQDRETLDEKARDKIDQLKSEYNKMGNRADYARSQMTANQRWTNDATVNAAAEKEYAQQFDQMQAQLRSQIKALHEALADRRADRIRTPFDIAKGGASGAAGVILSGVLNAQRAEQVQDGIGGFIDRYFKTQQDLLKNDPLRTFQRENERITKLRAEGAIDDREANLMRGRARQDLDKAFPMTPPAFAGLIRANSAEASKAILATMLPKIKPEDRPLKEIAQGIDRTNELLEEQGKRVTIELKAANFQ